MIVFLFLKKVEQEKELINLLIFEKQKFKRVFNIFLLNFFTQRIFIISFSLIILKNSSIFFKLTKNPKKGIEIKTIEKERKKKSNFQK